MLNIHKTIHFYLCRIDFQTAFGWFQDFPTSNYQMILICPDSIFWWTMVMSSWMVGSLEVGKISNFLSIEKNHSVENWKTPVLANDDHFNLCENRFHHICHTFRRAFKCQQVTKLQAEATNFEHDFIRQIFQQIRIGRDDSGFSCKKTWSRDPLNAHYDITFLSPQLSPKLTNCQDGRFHSCQKAYHSRLRRNFFERSNDPKYADHAKK